MQGQSRAVKVKEAIEIIEKDGWFMVRTKGTHPA